MSRCVRFFELGRVVLRFRWEDERVAFAGDSAEALRTETENLNISGRTTGSRSPAGPRRLGTATRISASLFRRLSAFFWSTPGQDPKAAKYAVLTPGPGIFVNVRNGPMVVIPPPSETPRVSPCEPLCAIFLRKPSVYPLSLVKANVGRLCEKLKIGIRSGLKQRCGGNFLAIVAGTILSEKLNFTGGFFEWRRPFDFSTR